MHGPERNRRLTACARSRSLGTRTRRPHRLAGAGRPGPRCERCRRCTHGDVPEPAAHDANVPDYQSLPSRALASNRKRKSGNACPLAKLGMFPFQPAASAGIMRWFWQISLPRAKLLRNRRQKWLERTRFVGSVAGLFCDLMMKERTCALESPPITAGLN